MQFLASQPVSIAKVMDISIKLYKAIFKKMIGYFLILAGFGIVSNFILHQLIPLQQANPGITPSSAYIGLLFIYVFSFSLVSFIFYSALIYRMNNLVHQRDDSFSDGLKFGLKKLFPAFVGFIFYTIALIGGTILLVVPGIIVSLSMAFFLYFVVLDSLGGYASIRASHKLVWGHWWRTATVFTIPSVIVFILYFLLGGLAGFIGTNHKLAIDTIIQVISAFTTPFFISVALVQFHDLKLRKSGSDLELRLAK